MSEIEFAQILGIGYGNYHNIKNNKTRAKIRDYREKAKVDRIRYILGKESRYYSSEEIDNICNKFQISKDILFKYICCGEKEEHVSNYIELLKNKEKIWIGKARCSREFAKKYSKTILESAKRRSINLCKRYSCSNEQEDIASNSLMYILEQCGDIERNFSDNDEIAREIINARIYICIKHACLQKIRKPKESSFYRKFTYKGDLKEINVFDRGIEDKSQNIQDEVEEKILGETFREQELSPEEVCIKVLTMNVEAGLSRKEALAKTGEMLGISPEEMLQSIQKYMIEQKRVRKTSSGEFVVGEGDER